LYEDNQSREYNEEIRYRSHLKQKDTLKQNPFPTTIHINIR